MTFAKTFDAFAGCDSKRNGCGSLDHLSGQGDVEVALRALLEGPMDDGRRFGGNVLTP